MDVFTYGTLSLPHVMEALTGTLFRHEPAMAQGYDRFLLKNEIYPGIIAAEGQTTDGILYRDVDDQSFQLLERFEGDEYEVREIEVVPDNGTAQIARAFVIPHDKRECLSSDPWDAEFFQATYAGNYAAVCRQYFRRNE